MTSFVHKLCLAPMLGYTDKHFRKIIRLFSKNTTLYTEMLSSTALQYSDSNKINKLLNFSGLEHYIGAQLAVSDIEIIANCVRIIEDYNYDEINLNMGCPSKKAACNKFGIKILENTDLAAECVNKAYSISKLPISIKLRLGIGDIEMGNDWLEKTINKLSKAGCSIFIIHARLAYLNKYGAKLNLKIPKINYKKVYEIKKKFPNLKIIINGDIRTTQEVIKHLENVDGVMIGREAYKNPSIFADIERVILGKSINEDLPNKNILDFLLQYIKYIKTNNPKNINYRMIRHINCLCRNFVGAREIRVKVSEANISNYMDTVNRIEEKIISMKLSNHIISEYKKIII